MLEAVGQLELLVVNAQHVKAVPGRKTDTHDAAWIASLLRHGLLRGSFIPPRPLRELRDLTRYRSELVHDRVRLVNRPGTLHWRELNVFCALPITVSMLKGKVLDPFAGGARHEPLFLGAAVVVDSDRETAPSEVGMPKCDPMTRCLRYGCAR